MSLGSDFNMYKEEIELIRAQNPVECDLYSIIASIMRERQQANEISLRDVSTRRKTKDLVESKKIRGDSGFPDFLIWTRDKKTAKENLLGAIEAKYVGLDLGNHIEQLERLKQLGPSRKSKRPTQLEQLRDHLEFYKRVIYTNGLKWQYYDKDKSQDNWQIELGEIEDRKTVNGKVDYRTIHDREICWNEDEKWTDLLGKLDAIKWNDKK